jgi:hypothetical protein
VPTPGYAAYFCAGSFTAQQINISIELRVWWRLKK